MMSNHPTSLIKEAGAIIVERLEANERFHWETVFIVGDKLNIICLAVAEPDCGYEGATRDKRYNAAVQAEVLSVTHMLHLTRMTLWRWRTVAETFGKRRKQIVDAKPSLTNVLKCCKAKNPDAALDEFFATGSAPTASKRQVAAPRQAEMIDAIKTAAVTGVIPTESEIASTFELKERAARDMARGVKAGVEAAKEIALNISPDDLPKSWKDKYDILERRLRRQIDAEVENKVMARAKVLSEEYFLPEWKKAVEFQKTYEKFFPNYVANRKAPFKKPEFALLMKALHPDTASNFQTEAMDMLMKMREKLVLPEPLGIDMQQVPGTLDGIDALKKAMAANARKAAKRAAE